MSYKQGVREDADFMELADEQDEVAADQQLRIDAAVDDGEYNQCMGCAGTCSTCLRGRQL